MGARVPSFGFTGVIGSGKTEYLNTLKGMLEREFSVKVYVASFSVEITKVAKERYGMKERDRKLLQHVGNKEREKDPAIWAKLVIKDINKLGSIPFVVDSIRMPEEAEAIRQAFPDFFVIKMAVGNEKARMEAQKVKHGAYPTKEELADNSDAHVDEIDADIVLTNTYKRGDMERQIRSIIDAIKRRTFPSI